MPKFEQRSELPVSAEQAFEWHCRPGAFQRLAPPWESIKLVSSEGVSEGSQAEIRLRIGPVPRRWIAEHHDIVPGREFTDTQLAGPFREWVHTHRVEPLDAERCELTDRIKYTPPFGWFGQIAGSWLIRRQLLRTFQYRHTATRQDVQFHSRWSPSFTNRDTPAMRIVIGGSTGLVGSALVPFLTTGGYEVARLARGSSGQKSNTATGDGTSTVAWNPAQGTIDKSGLEGSDAVVHLGGHNIAHGRWNAGMKRLIRDSRINSTRLLAETLAGMDRPPRVFVCASAIGFYGHRGDEVLTEDSEPGPSFLSETCADWEAATAPASAAGIRVVNLRIGVVLSPQGGALQKMLLPFKLGGGGVVGSGRQWWSWIALDDLVRVITFCLQNDSLEGPVNAVAPGCVNNRDFTKTLGRVLRRPTIFPMPAPIVRLAFGEMGEELMLGSSRVVPDRLTAAGFDFAWPDLEPALRHLLGK